LKRLALAVTLSAAAASVCLFFSGWTRDYTQTERSRLSAAAPVESLSSFRENWDQHRKIFACFIEEDHLEKAEDCLRLAELYAEKNDLTAASFELARFSLLLQDIADYCTPSLDNIL